MVERVLDDLDEHSETPKQIISDHGDRLGETYGEPLPYIAVQLANRNRRNGCTPNPRRTAVKPSNATDSRKPTAVVERRGRRVAHHASDVREYVSCVSRIILLVPSDERESTFRVF